MSREPEPLRRTPVKAYDFTTQDAFDWIDPGLSVGMAASHQLICKRPHSASTLTARSSFPPVTVMGRRFVLVRRVFTSPKRGGPTSHKMPFTNLCNRLVVNEHPWDPPTHERPTLAGLAAPSIAALCPARPCWGRNSETPGRRRVARRHPRPRVTWRLVPRTPAVTDSLPVTRRPPPFCFGRRQLTRWRCLPLREPDSEVTGTSCRSTRHTGALAPMVGRSQEPLHRWRTTTKRRPNTVPGGKLERAVRVLALCGR
jgi:hypothetical protein